MAGKLVSGMAERRRRLLLACGVAGSVLLAGAARAEDTLNLYNWIDYIGPGTVPRFEQETGIKVHYDVYDSNDMLEAKLLAGGAEYDVVVPSWGYLDRMIRAGVFRKLDKSHIPNLANLDPVLMTKAAEVDPGNEYAVPWGITSTGIGIDEPKVRAILGPDARLDSWDLVFDPAIVSKLAACGVGIVDEPLDVMPIAQHYLGLTPYSDNPADYPPAVAVLKKIRPYIKEFNSTSYHTDLASGELCVVLGWSNDVSNVRRRIAAEGGPDRIRYLIPADGAPINYDFMAIPKGAPHPEAAERWINYMEAADVNADLTNAIATPTANKAALPLVKPSLAQDPAIYPPPAVFAHAFAWRTISPETRRLAVRLWNQMKNGV